MNLNRSVIQAADILKDLDNDPNDKIVKFMKAISILYLTEPNMNIIELADIIMKSMPKTTVLYNKEKKVE